MAEIKAYDAEGRKVLLDADDLESAERLGYRVATPEDIQREAMKAEYGGLSDSALAAASGVAKGLTFGLSDIAISGLGGREALKAYDTLYGTERGIGEVAGAIAPIFLTGGAGAGARGAIGAAEAARAAEGAVSAARAAEAATGGTSLLGAAGKAFTAVPRAAEAAGVATRSALGLAERPILGKAVQLATEGAIESAIQGAGDEAARLAVDNELAGEKLGQIFFQGLKAGGFGLAAGGVLGGGVGALGSAISKTGEAVRKLGYGAASEAAEELATKPGIREQALRFLSKVRGADESVAARIANSAEGLKAARLADDVIEENIGRVTDELTDWYSRSDQLSKFGRESAEKFGAAEDLLPRGQSIDANGLPFSWADRQVAEFERVTGPIQGDIAEILSKKNKDRYSRFSAGTIRDRIDDAREKIAKASSADRGLVAAQELNSLKMSIDPIYQSLKTSKKLTNQAVAPFWKNWGTTLRESLEDEAVFGGLGRFQREMNAGLTEMLGVQSHLADKWLVPFKKSKVDWTRQDFVAAGEKVRANLKATSVHGVNIPMQALKENFDGNKKWLTTLLRDGKLTAADRKLAQSQLDAIPRIMSELDEAKKIAEGGAWYRKFSGQGDPILASIAGTATLGPVGLLAGVLARPQIAVRGLELANKFVVGETGKIGNAVGRATSKMVEKAKRVPAAAVVAGEKQREFDRQRAIVAQIAQQAPSIREAVSKQSSWIGYTAPNMQRSGADTVIRGALYLDSKAPGKMVSAIPFSKPQPPTKQEIAEFNRRARAVNNPMVLLSDLEAGKLTPETVEAVRDVYPETFAEIQGKLAEKIADMSQRGQVPSIGDRVQLSLIMGAPMTPEMQPAAIRTFQSIYAQQSPEQRQGMAPSRGAGKAPNFAANYQSGADETAQAQ